MKSAIFLMLLFFGAYSSFLPAQHPPVFYSLIIHPVFGNSNLNASFYKLNLNDSVMIESLKFYISGIEFLKGEKMVWQEKTSFHLVDASEKKSLSIHLITPHPIPFDSIRFNLGIDSTTNVSGAMGGDLDPTKGMYWTWQSGYINFKMEGKSNLCKTRNNEFQFHLGGYMSPSASLQTITLPVYSTEQIVIDFDVEKFFSQIDLSYQNQLMSPGKEAVILSEKVSALFSVQEK